MRLPRFRSLAAAGVSITMALVVLGGLGQFLIPRAGAQGVPPTLDRLPVIFVSYPDTATVRSFDNQGAFMADDNFSENFGDDEPSTVEGLLVDYVTLTGLNNPDGNVVVADAETGNIFAGIGLQFSSGIGFGAAGGFEAGDMIFSADVVPDNDRPRSTFGPARSKREILIAKPGEDKVDIFMYDESTSGAPLHFVSSAEIDIDEGDFVTAGEMSNLRVGESRSDEILVGDASAGTVMLFSASGTATGNLATISFHAGDQLATGNIDGIGSDELVVAHVDGGAINVYRPLSGSNNLVASFAANFGPNDKVAVADVTGNGTAEIVVADADTGVVTIYTYNMLENPAVPNDEFFTLRSFNAGFAAGAQLAVLPVRYPDYDGDGLYDHWEEDGLDVDNNGSIDLDLPSMGADPRHKDLFLELDWIAGEKPDSDEIAAMVEAFAVAPIDAGVVRNPDQLPGINLWVDTGNLGGGNEIPASSDPVCLLDSSFYALKSANFDPARRLVFRYGLSGQRICDGGGWGEIGGNDFIEFIHDGGTIMHELGHTLGLRHGGNDNINCKPNYVSVMNYDHQFGIFQNDGGKILDYSPPRNGSGRGNATLPALDENALSESMILDASDTSNRFAFTNANGDKVRNAMNQPADWDGDGDLDGQNLSVNIDDANSNNNPARCENSFFEVLNGHDDWSTISIPFGHFGDAADGAINPTTEEELSYEELVALQEDLSTTDLAVDILASREPVVAGQGMVYAVTVDNLGPNPADFTHVQLVLSSELLITDVEPGCALNITFPDVFILNCELGTLPAGESRELIVDVQVNSGFVFEFGPDATLDASATVSSAAEFFNDSNPDNNSKSIETTVVAEADLDITYFFDPSTFPNDLLPGEQREIELPVELFNNGPSAPVDVQFGIEFVASPQVQVTPAPENPISFSALALETPELVSSLFTIECLAPGAGEVLFRAEAFPVNAEDPDVEFNADLFELTVNCVLPVAIDIQPGTVPNVIDIDNLTGDAPLAVLTTAAGERGLPFAVDAAGIDASRTLFGTADALLDAATPSGAPDLRGQIVLDDVAEGRGGGDGDLDAFMLFGMADSGLAVTDTEACVRGVLDDAELGEVVFFGCDAVVAPPDICVSNFTGHALKPQGPECRAQETKIVFELDGPVKLCFDHFTGAITQISGPTCPVGGQLVVMPDEGPRTVCASLFDGKLRSRANNQCVSNELPYILE